MAEKGGAIYGFADLELIRAKAAISVTRSCALLSYGSVGGIPRATWYRWKRASGRLGYAGAALILLIHVRWG